MALLWSSLDNAVKFSFGIPGQLAYKIKQLVFLSWNYLNFHQFRHFRSDIFVEPTSFNTLMDSSNPGK